MDTRPPIFKEATEPLDAEEWINTMQDKFRVLRLTKVLKTEYAAHQLQGPAGMWWKHHRTTFPPNAQISWREFTEAFRGVYIPPGLVEMKLGEFLALNQGIKTVTQYCMPSTTCVIMLSTWLTHMLRELLVSREG
jgi:hypothetical protein